MTTHVRARRRDAGARPSQRREAPRIAGGRAQIGPETVDAISTWLRAALPKLDTASEWAIPPLSGFDPNGYPSNAKANIALKYYLSKQWRRANTKRRRELAEWVVVSWGRIQGNDSWTIKQHVRVAGRRQAKYAQAGIASLSKILAMSDPDVFAVYDARVAAALNALQLRANVRHGIAFRYVGGRNVMIHGRRGRHGRLVDQGFVHVHPRASLRNNGWLVPGPGLNYLTYLAVLKECKRRLPGYKLPALEIALFANAVDVCASQMP